MNLSGRVCTWIVVVVTAVLSARAIAKDTRRPTLEIGDPPAVILYDRPGHERPQQDRDFEGYRVLVAAWTDGRIVWSSRMPGAGYPYYSDHIDPARIRAVADAADRITSATSYLIVDARSRHIEVTTASGKTLEVASSHPHFTAPNLEVKSTGITVKNDRATTEPLSEKEQAFQRYRQEFDALSQLILDLAPTTTTAEAKHLKFQLDVKD